MTSSKRTSHIGALLLGLSVFTACSDEGGITRPGIEPGASVLQGTIAQDRTLSADTVYTLRGFVRVANGATLTIQPGTRIEGDFNTLGSSLFILRGAKIIANGTRENPIVFTSSQPVGQRQPGDWGGLIMIGNGITNRGAPTFIEGTGTSVDNPRVDYSGGTDNNDNSGILRYVRIEFAGYATAPNEELNSLTMAAVGRGTTIEYVQVLKGLDDSFEWFGGAVDGRYLISYEAADDHFDASEGYVGRNQYLIAFQSIRPEPRQEAGSAATDPQGIENDGCWADNCNAANRGDSEPFTVPVFANFTLIGPPAGTWDTPAGNVGMMLRRGVGGYYVNGIVARYRKTDNTGAAISLRDSWTVNRINEGRLEVKNILLAENAVAFQPQTGTTVQTSLDLAANAIEQHGGTAASLFVNLPGNPTRAEDFDWAPAPNSPARAGGMNSFSGALAAAAGSFVTPTAFRGAVNPAGPRWWEGWTSYARN
ncbi:hypothetical protein BH23GEM3_BH23GEM3_25030 [soil metagenome]